MYDDDDDINAAGMTGAERELEAALSGLRPAGSTTAARDQLMFQAGAASARRGQRRQLQLWRAAAAMLAVTTGLSWVSHIDRGTGHNPGTVAQREVSPSSPLPDSEPPSPFSVLSLRNAVLTRGLDALPGASPSPAGPIDGVTPSPRPGVNSTLFPLNSGDSL